MPSQAWSTQETTPPGCRWTSLFSVPSIVNANLNVFLGKSLAEDAALWAFASPLHQVTSQAAPFLLLHGTADTVVPYAQSLEMREQLRKHGVVAELCTAEETGHGFFNLDVWRDGAMMRVAEFLRVALR